MIASTVKFSQIEDRIDAEYYKPEYIETENLFNQIKNRPMTIPLSEALSYIKGYAFESEYYTTEGTIGVYRVSDIENGVNFSDIVKVPNFFWEKFKKFRIRSRDIIMTVTGNTVGKAILMPDDMPQLLMNQNAAIWRTKGKINQYYLYIFVTAKPFQTKIERIARAGTRPFIGIDILKENFVPIPSQSFQQKIEKMVKEAQKKHQLADEQYKEAEEILNKELGFGKIDLSTQKTFETRFSEINERIDPKYYQPIFNEAEKVFKKQKTVNLGDISLEIKYGTSEDLFYVEKGIPFLRVTDINKFSTIEPMEGKFINNFDAERLKEYQVKMDDIIISRTGTIGLAVYIDEKLDRAIYGSYFIKVKPQYKDLYNRFIAFFISSEIGRLQTNRWASGGIQTNLTIDAIKSIRIPILSRPIQQRICSLIQDSLKLREETENLLNEAKRKVEKMVLGE